MFSVDRVIECSRAGFLAYLIEQPVVDTAAAVAVDRWISPMIGDIAREYLNITIEDPGCAPSEEEFEKSLIASGVEIIGGALSGYLVVEKIFGTIAYTFMRIEGRENFDNIRGIGFSQYFLITTGLRFVYREWPTNHICPNILNSEAASQSTSEASEETPA
jgi:hypothetical protein